MYTFDATPLLDPDQADGNSMVYMYDHLLAALCVNGSEYPINTSLNKLMGIIREPSVGVVMGL